MASFGSMTPTMGNANQVLGQPTALNQVGPGSANFNPQLFPQAPMSVQSPMSPQQNPGQPMTPQVPPPMQAPPQPQGMGQPQGTVGLPPQVPETMMILKALIDRQKLLGKHEEAVRNAILPQQMPPSRVTL